MLQETPGKAVAARCSRLVEQLLVRQEQLEVLQGIQGLRLDARGVAAAAAVGVARTEFEVTVRGQFRLLVSMPPAATEEGIGTGVFDGDGPRCSVRAKVLPGFAVGGRSPSTEAMLPLIGE